jgi:hypothetical protein
MMSATSTSAFSSSSSSSSLLRRAFLLFVLAVLPCGGTANDEPEYPCFTSTRDILTAQLTTAQRDFRICPDTHINIGLPADASFTKFVGGDFPLSVVHNDVTVACGSNGKSSNNCTLNGGLYQFITIPTNPLVNKTITTDNLKLKGITFTGSLNRLPFPASATGFINPASVLVSAPGKNMVVEDCIFRSLRLNSTVFFVVRSLLATETNFPNFSVDMTIKKSKFRNIKLGFGLITVRNNTLKLEDNNFKGIEIDETFCPGCPSNNALLIEAIESNMDMTGNKFQDVETYSGIVFASGRNRSFTYSDNMADGLTIVDIDNRPYGDYCEAGLIVDKIRDGRFDKCFDLFA